MSLFGSLMGDVEEDPFFGSHLRHMRQMNNMMNSLFADPFGMLGDGPMAIGGPRQGGSLMPFMPQMPSLNKLFSGDMFEAGQMGNMGMGSSYSSSTVVMSSGPHGKPQVYSASSSTKIGPNGIKETRNTLQDSRTGTKKMSIGHHIGERGHIIEREQNVYSGDAEERQDFINIEEDEAHEFDREFQMKAGAITGRHRGAILPRPPAARAPSPPRLALPPALPPAPSALSAATSNTDEKRRQTHSPSGYSSRHIDIASGHSSEHSSSGPTRSGHTSYRPTGRRPLRTTASPLTTSVRDVYSGAAPHRPRARHQRASPSHTHTHAHSHSHSHSAPRDH